MRFLVLLLFAFPANAMDKPIECLESGCTLVPNTMLERNNQVIEKMMRELKRLRAITGCA